MLEPYVLVQLVFLRYALQVGEDFVPGGVASKVVKIQSCLRAILQQSGDLDLQVGPLRVRFPGELVVVGGNIACTSGVPWKSYSEFP